MRIHSKLLHEALQKEETRAIVIEVEEDPEEPEEDEEFYAANFEFLGQEDEDEEEEEEGMEPGEEMPPLLDPEEDRPRLCQQRVPLEVNGILTSLHTLYDWESKNTLVRKESARRIGLQAVRAPRQAIKGYQGEGLITHHRQCVLFAPVGCGWQHPSGARPWGRRDHHRHPHETATCGERDFPCHQSLHAMDGNWRRASGVAHQP